MMNAVNDPSVNQALTRPLWNVGWIVAFLAFPAGGLAVSLLLGVVDSAVEGLIGGAIAGAVLGLAQWLVLRRTQPISATWVLATTLGLGVGFGISMALFGADNSLQSIALRGLITGGVLAVTQYAVLRPLYPRAAWWIATIAILYPISWVITTSVIKSSVENGYVVFGSSGALVFQIVSGFALSWILRTR